MRIYLVDDTTMAGRLRRQEGLPQDPQLEAHAHVRLMLTFRGEEEEEEEEREFIQDRTRTGRDS